MNNGHFFIKVLYFFDGMMERRKHRQEAVMTDMQTDEKTKSYTNLHGEVGCEFIYINGGLTTLHVM